MPVSHRRAPRVARSPTVYTNAPIRRREAQSSHLCTLSRPSRLPTAHSSIVYTNAPIRRGKAPYHPSVYTIAVTRGRPRHDSVHKRPNLASEGSCHPFVYTIVIPRPLTTQARSPTVYTNAPNRRGEARSFHLCTLSRPPRAAHGSIVYTNAPKVQQKSHRESGTSSHLSCLSKNAAILSNGMASFPPPS